MMDVHEQLKQQLAINRKINKKLPSELRLPETEQEFVQRELAILSDQLEVTEDKTLIAHMQNRQQKLLDYIKQFDIYNKTAQ